VDEKNLATGLFSFRNSEEFSNCKLVSAFKAEFDWLWNTGREK